MDRHSSYIFIWLQLELCAMAVLLTRGEGGRAPGEAAGSPAGPGASGERLRAALGASGRTSVGVAGSPAGAARGRPPGTAPLGGLGQGEPLRRGTWLFWKAGCN